MNTSAGPRGSDEEEARGPRSLPVWDNDRSARRDRVSWCVGGDGGAKQPVCTIEAGDGDTPPVSDRVFRLRSICEMPEHTLDCKEVTRGERAGETPLSDVKIAAGAVGNPVQYGD